MLKLGLTGSIATGKSTVLKTLAAQGIPTFSSDEAVHELYAGEAVGPVDALFPGVGASGTIDRAELSRRLVAAPGRLQELEAIVHPLVRRRIAKFLAESATSGADIAVVDIPLLYETGHDWGLDAVIVTTVNEAEQRRRALRRRGMTAEKLDAILARQMPQAEKVTRADYVIDTGKPMKDATEDVVRLVKMLRKSAT
ncbi:MAG: dephospho-CoA kinase [Hyphomicrobiales bacterium]|nr:MAG: dephospho-CoA kinase [Hyphomicrobiales bacterium]